MPPLSKAKFLRGVSGRRKKDRDKSQAEFDAEIPSWRSKKKNRGTFSRATGQLDLSHPRGQLDLSHPRWRVAKIMSKLNFARTPIYKKLAEWHAAETAGRRGWEIYSGKDSPEMQEKVRKGMIPPRGFWKATYPKSANLSTEERMKRKNKRKRLAKMASGKVLRKGYK
jgi:hypothetical protein